MPSPQYIELHARSAFSFLEERAARRLLRPLLGDGEPGDGDARCRQRRRFPRFHLAAKKPGVKAHIGAEITATKAAASRCWWKPRGYQNLCRLITRMKLRVPKSEA